MGLSALQFEASDSAGMMACRFLASESGKYRRQQLRLHLIVELKQCFIVLTWESQILEPQAHQEPVGAQKTT